MVDHTSTPYLPLRPADPSDQTFLVNLISWAKKLNINKDKALKRILSEQQGIKDLSDFSREMEAKY